MTRIKYWLWKIVESPLAALLAFAFVNIFFCTSLYFFVGDKSAYTLLFNDIKAFLGELKELFLKNEENQALNLAVNLLSFAAVIWGASHWLKRLAEFCINSASLASEGGKIIKNALLGLYVLLTAANIMSPAFAVSMVHSGAKEAAEFVSRLFVLNSIGSVPVNSFGINLLIRYIFFHAAVFLLGTVRPLIRYLNQRVKVENGTVTEIKAGDTGGVKRIVRWFYDEQTNTFNKKNISYVAGGIVTILGALGIAADLKVTDGEVLKNAWKLVYDILQLSTIDQSPFAEPIPAAKLINIAFRIFSVFILCVCAIFAVYVINILRMACRIKYPDEAEEKKAREKIKRHLKTMGIISVILVTVIVFLFLISKGADEIQNAKTELYKACGGIAAFYIAAAVAVLFIKKARQKGLFRKLWLWARDDVEKLAEIFKKIVKKLTMPIINELTKIDGEHATLNAAANFCAVASLFTTFLGLINFFHDSIITFNIPLMLISVLICFCITTGVQYSMLEIGMRTGKFMGRIFAKESFKEDEKAPIKFLKWFWKKGVKIFLSAFLLIVYCFPLTISSLFSFGSIFGGAASLGGYREEVNNNVWNVVSDEAKKAMGDISSVYDAKNNQIQKNADELFSIYSKTYSAMTVWDRDNKDDAVDGHALEFIDRTKGIPRYKETINKILLEDRFNQYDVTSKTQNVYYGKSLIYTVSGHEITEPFEEILGSFEEGEEQKEAAVKTFGEVISRENHDLGKYQAVDILANQYVSLMKEAKDMYDAAIEMKKNGRNEINELGIDENFTNNFTEVYYNNISEIKRIFEAYTFVRNNILADEKGAVSEEEFTSVNQLSAAVIKYSMYNKSDNPQKLMSPPEMDEENETQSIQSPQEEGAEKAEAEKKADDVKKTEISLPEDNARLTNTDFETRIERLTAMLSYLPNIKGTEYKVEDSKGKIDSSITDTLEKIKAYSDYADSRKIDLVFGLDVVYRGEECSLPHIKMAKAVLNLKNKIQSGADGTKIGIMNPYNEQIGEVYEHSEFASILLVIAILIDLMPILAGFFMSMLDLFGPIKKRKVRRGTPTSALKIKHN